MYGGRGDIRWFPQSGQLPPVVEALLHYRAGPVIEALLYGRPSSRNPVSLLNKPSDRSFAPVPDKPRSRSVASLQGRPRDNIFMFYTYILESKRFKRFYIGYTDDLKRRVKEHNDGKSISTKPYIPWVLIYYEACLNKKDAIRREKYLKTTQGRRFTKLRLREYISE